MSFFIPGKTFLVGEYSVLVGGAALGLATKPCFEVSLESRSPFQFHPDSPAGRYLKLQGLQSSVQISDPYKENGINGGFGKSTAEFLAAAKDDLHSKEFTQVRQIYLDLHKDEVVKPSGVDLAFQYFGQVCLAEVTQNRYSSFHWPFANLEFFVVATGLKVATHQHLTQLDLATISHLPKYSDDVIQEFKVKDDVKFISSMKEWSRILKAAGLTHSNSMQLEEVLLRDSKILAVKACGALGADVILVFCQVEDRLAIRDSLINKKLKVLASSKDLCDGMVKYVG